MLLLWQFIQKEPKRIDPTKNIAVLQSTIKFTENDYLRHTFLSNI